MVIRDEVCSSMVKWARISSDEAIVYKSRMFLMINAEWSAVVEQDGDVENIYKMG